MEKSLKVALEELATVRVVCKRQGCGAVVEMPTDRLESVAGHLTCPSCNQPFPAKQVGGGMSGFRALGLAMRNLRGEEHFGVEFVVPQPPGG